MSGVGRHDARILIMSRAVPKDVSVFLFAGEAGRCNNGMTGYVGGFTGVNEARAYFDSELAGRCAWAHVALLEGGELRTRFVFDGKKWSPFGGGPG